MSRSFTRLGGGLAGAALAATLLMVPATAATASPSLATASAADECEVTGGSMSWGVKESFRSYISGSIANGSWETSGGVSYETPYFTWTEASGTINPADGTGSVSFTGTVHFSGHDGVLDLNLENPTIEFEGGGKAALLLDTKSTNVEGEVTVDAAQEWVGEVTAPTALATENESLKLDGLAVSLTNSGANAFAGFYEAGADLDPISLDVQLAGCDVQVAAPVTPETTPAESEPAAPVAEEASIPWLPIIVGGVALVVIALTTGMLIGGRKKKSDPSAAGAGAGEESSPEL